MRLPYLDQKIPLHWGEAQQLATAIEWVLTQQLVPPERPTLKMVLSFGPLTRLGTRLLARQRQEARRIGPPPRKPRLFTLRYDEVAALLVILPLAPAAGAAWGEVHRVSLNLERYIDFTA
jgi:hypothetical protein